MSVLEKLGLAEYGCPTVLGFMLIFAAIIAAILAGAVKMDSVTCAQYGRETGRATTYRVPAGCFVGFGGKFIPLDEYNARAITHSEASK